jgi:hypothetical protein
MWGEPTRRPGGKDPGVNRANAAVAQAASKGKPRELIDRLRAERKTEVIRADLEWAMAHEPALTEEQRTRLANILLGS